MCKVRLVCEFFKKPLKWYKDISCSIFRRIGFNTCLKICFQVNGIVRFSDTIFFKNFILSELTIQCLIAIYR